MVTTVTTTPTNQNNGSDNVLNIARKKETDTQQKTKQQPSVETLLQIIPKKLIEIQIAEIREHQLLKAPRLAGVSGPGS
jgi:hypothetical protein